jgi:hypothetical protein
MHYSFFIIPAQILTGVWPEITAIVGLLVGVSTLYTIFFIKPLSKKVSKKEFEELKDANTVSHAEIKAKADFFYQTLLDKSNRDFETIQRELSVEREHNAEQIKNVIDSLKMRKK